jgi:hypothetical protein
VLFGHRWGEQASRWPQLGHSITDDESALYQVKLNLLLFCVVCDSRYMQRLRPIDVAPAVNKGNPLP